jgi:isoquinoline 1-oxidoreductase subunit alpha
MITFSLNKMNLQFDGDPHMPLLWFLRDEVRLTGTKYGCGLALCGACTVHVNGNPVRSCQYPMSAVSDQQVTTIEAVHETAVGRTVQAAWVKLQVPQCGYCQSGQVMSATALLTQKRQPTDEDIDAAMSGNVCRCATYVRIRAAIHEAAKDLG